MFDTPRTKVDFSFILNLQGLNLPICETPGTESDNYANFVRFSLIFNLFVPESYKNTFYDIFSILKHICMFLNVFADKM